MGVRETNHLSPQMYQGRRRLFWETTWQGRERRQKLLGQHCVPCLPQTEIQLGPSPAAFLQGRVPWEVMWQTSILLCGLAKATVSLGSNQGRDCKFNPREAFNVKGSSSVWGCWLPLVSLLFRAALVRGAGPGEPF